MTSGIAIRRATAADATAIRDLTRLAYAKWMPLIGREPLPMQADYDRAVAEHRIDLAERDGKLIALIEMIEAEDHLLIENLAVHPDAQGQGLGERLLRHAETIAQGLGVPEVRLYTNDKFAANITFYAKRGYTITERGSIVPGSVTVFMKKSIAPAQDLSMPTLHDPITIGDWKLKNRILMAPMTRGRATRDFVPQPIMGEYYAQRASAGLILTEATGISREGLGWPYAPGIWTGEQVKGWRAVTKAVHEKGGLILCQLWHMGRVVPSEFLDGAAPVSASATLAPGGSYTYEGKKPYTRARALDLDEIPRVIEDYRNATVNALEAGFDGVQLHGANGYLVDQFLRDGTNTRTDAYGGSIGNRLRFLIEATKAIISVAGAGRTSVRLSPNDASEGCGGSDMGEQFPAAANALGGLGIALLEMRNARAGGDDYTGNTSEDHVPAIRRAFQGALALNSNYAPQVANEILARGEADAFAFGRRFLANPDLPRRFAEAAVLSPDDPATFYSQGEKGYTDYPAMV